MNDFGDKVERAIVTVIGKDRVGIVADVARVLAHHNVNILDINQKVLGEQIFAMTMLVDIAKANVNFSTLKESLHRKGTEFSLKIMLQHSDIFKYMHRI